MPKIISAITSNVISNIFGRAPCIEPRMVDDNAKRIAACKPNVRPPLLHADICGYCRHTGLPLYTITTETGVVLDKDVWMPVTMASIRSQMRGLAKDGDSLVVHVQRPRRKYRRRVVHTVSYAQDRARSSLQPHHPGLIELAFTRPF